MTTRAPARDRLLDAADELLFSEGVTSTPVDTVLSRAGVAPATLYAHFGSKEGLVVEALRRRLARWDETWAAAVARADDDEGRLLAVFDAMADFRGQSATARWCAFLGTAAEHAHPSTELADALSADTRLLRRRLRELAEPVAGDRAAEVADQLVLVVTGTLATMLRQSPRTAMARGRAVATALVSQA